MLDLNKLVQKDILKFILHMLYITMLYHVM